MPTETDTTSLSSHINNPMNEKTNSLAGHVMKIPKPKSNFILDEQICNTLKSVCARDPKIMNRIYCAYMHIVNIQRNPTKKDTISPNRKERCALLVFTRALALLASPIRM